jgi:hypothetical protein
MTKIEQIINDAMDAGKTRIDLTVSQVEELVKSIPCGEFIGNNEYSRVFSLDKPHDGLFWEWVFNGSYEWRWEDGDELYVYSGKTTPMVYESFDMDEDYDEDRHQNVDDAKTEWHEKMCERHSDRFAAIQSYELSDDFEDYFNPKNEADADSHLAFSDECTKLEIRVVDDGDEEDK